MVDDLRPELGIYGSPVAITPNMDAFGRSALVFDRAYTSQPLCGPSRAALLTGMRPATTGVTGHGVTVDAAVPNAVTMPDLFKAAGYQTISIGKVYHERDDDADGWSKLTHRSRNPWPTPPTSTSRWADGSTLGSTLDVAIAEEELTRHSRSDAPFFMAVGIRAPHLPFAAPASDWDRYTPDDLVLPINPYGQRDAPPWAMPPVEELGFWDFADFAGQSQTLPLQPSQERELRWGYLASVSYADGLVGDLLASLRRNGLEDNTIVVLWGDHGFKLGDHGSWMKSTNSEIDTRVPLMIRVPGLTEPGTRSQALVETVDLYPTLAELAGLAIPGTLEGLSATPLFSDPNRAWKKAAFVQQHRGVPGLGRVEGYTVRDPRYRYTAWFASGGALLAQELYDLETDPTERKNIAGYPAQAARVEAMEQVRRDGWETVRSDVR